MREPEGNKVRDIERGRREGDIERERGRNEEGEEDRVREHTERER